MGYADLAVECDRPNAKGLEQTILVCKKWLANYFAADTLVRDRNQEFILLIGNVGDGNQTTPESALATFQSELTEKRLNAEATIRLATRQQEQATKLINLVELDIADIDEDIADIDDDIETFKSELAAGIEPDPKKVLFCINKLNALRARKVTKPRTSLERAIDSCDKAQVTSFRAEVMSEWLADRLTTIKEKLDRSSLPLLLSEAESTLRQFAMSGAAIDQEIEQLVPSLSKHQQELVYAWLQSKWEVREANWGTLYGKLKTSTNEQRVETFRNLEQPVTPVDVSLQTDVLKNGLDRETCSFRWGSDLFANLSDEVMDAMELIEKNYNRGRITTKQNLLKKSSQDSIGKLFRSGDAKRIGEMLVQVGSSVNLPPLNCP